MDGGATGGPGRPCPRRLARYAATTINHRLAALTGLVAFRQMRDPDARSPVPKGREAGSSPPRYAVACSVTWSGPSTDRRCGCASRGGCPGRWTGEKPLTCSAACASDGIKAIAGLMLLCGAAQRGAAFLMRESG